MPLITMQELQFIGRTCGVISMSKLYKLLLEFFSKEERRKGVLSKFR